MIAIILSLVISNEGVSQWKKLISIPGKQVRTVYFIDQLGDPKVGFVSFGDEVWKTNDGGITWQKTFFTSNSTDVSDFSFKDILTGWASSRGATNGCFVTHDGGNTWNGILGGKSAEGIYYNAHNKRLYLASWSNDPIYSVDEGVSWVPFFSGASYCGFAFSTDSTYGIMTTSTLNTVPYLRTSDGGITWYPINFSQECWQPLAIKGTNTIFAACEFSGNGLNKSVDGGLTWKTQNEGLLNYAIKTTGDMRGSACRLYLQSVEANRNGVYRSLDQGNSWECIGGPSSIFDKRFFVKDRHVFVGDTFGNLWYLYDTLGFKSEVRMNLSSDIVNFDSVAECLDSRQVIRFANPYSCDSVKITNITWLNSSPSFTLGTTGSLPRYLAPEHEDSLEINFIRQGTGTFGARVKITMEFLGYTKDTIITITGTRVKASKAILTSSKLNFDTLTTCESKMLTTSLVNNGCDSVVVSIDYTPPYDFSLTSPTTSFVLSPGSSTNVSVSFTSKIPGAKSDIVHFRVRPTVGSEYLIGLIVEGVVEKKLSEPAIYPRSLPFDTLSLCDTAKQYMPVYLRNTNLCDSLKILSATILDDADFGIFPPLAQPITLGPDSIISFQYSFSSSIKGMHNARCLLRIQNDTSVFDSIIYLSGVITDGKGVLSASPASFDFGTTTLCEERDSLVTLRNTGCDTLRVSVVGVQGLGFRVSGIGSPIIIPPSGSIDIPINTIVDTSQGNTSTGTITFTSDADNQITPITLSRGYTYPKSYSFHIAMLDGTAASGEIVRLAVVGEQGLGSTGSGVNRLDFDLSLNEDLLEYIRPEGSNTVNKNGSRITISNPNELTSNKDTLATLVYHVFLTKDSATDMSVSNVSINNGDTSSCAPRVAAITQAGFTYRYECGDKHIQSFLLTGNASLEITSIRPNPAKDEVFIEVSSATQATATIRIIDIEGKIHYQIPYTLHAGHQQLHIRTPHISEGSYFIELITSENSANQRLQIVR